MNKTTNLQECGMRMPALDALRILLMFGICMIHATGQGPYATFFPHNVLCACVLGFILISGYFGMKFRISKVIRLYSLAVGYCFLVPVIGGRLGSGFLGEVVKTWGAEWRYWFLHAYVLVMCVAPLVNPFFDLCRKQSNCKCVGMLLPLIFVGFVWCWLANLNHFRLIVPRPVGLVGCSFIVLLAGYCVGRFIRIVHFEKRFNAKIWIVLIVVSFFAVGVSKGVFRSYGCVVLLIMAVSFFCLAIRFRLSRSMSLIVSKLAPSMFGVYLLHCALYFPGMDSSCYGLLNHITSFCLKQGVNLYVAYLCSAGLAFILCIVIDAVRRLIVGRIRIISDLLMVIDCWYERFSSRIDNWLCPRLDGVS